MGSGSRAATDCGTPASRRGRGTTRLLVSTFLLVGAPAFAGIDDAAGPLEDSRLFEKTTSLGNVVLLYSDADGPSFQDSMQQTAFDFVPPDAMGLNAALLPQEGAALEAQAGGVSLGEHEIDVATADFDGNGFEEWVAAYTRRSGRIRVVIPQDLARGEPDPVSGLDQLGFTTTAFVDLQDEGLPAQSPNTDTDRPLRLRIAVGELDGDEGPEIALGYWDDTGMVRLVVIDTDGSLVPRVAANIATHALPPFTARPPGEGLPSEQTATRSTLFDIATGDFDGDGIHEIALVGTELTGANDWQLRARIYVYDSVAASLTQVLASSSTFPLVRQATAGEHLEQLEIAAGEAVAALPGDELAVGYRVDLSTILADQVAEDRLFMLSPDIDNQNFPLAVGEKVIHTDQRDRFPFAVQLADFDDDGQDEVVVISDDAVEIRGIVASGSLPQRGFPLLGSAARRQDFENTNTQHGTLAVRDLDPNADDSFSVPEIVSGTRTFLGSNRISLQSFGVAPAGGGGFSIALLAENAETEVGNAPNSFAIAPGRFNGPDIRLGMPKRFSTTEIEAPLVILAAPPLHFDVLDGSTFDVNDCFPTGIGCDFRSSYSSFVQTATTVTTEFHSDWALSASIEGEVSGLGAKVEGSLRGTFGEGFSRVASESMTQTISLGQNATVDDFIFAATVSYDTWEYPVFRGEEATPAGYVAVVRPRFEDPQGITTAWFNSKSWLAASFQPDHEVGNILSYREIAAPDEASGFVEEGRWSTGDLRTLTSQGGGGFWSLASTEVTARSTSRSATLGLEASVATEGGFDFNLGGFGPGSAKIRTEIDGTYAEEALSTTETRFEQTVGLNFEFGTLDPTVGQTNYGVIPYAYWTTTGSLVLDYAVRPELAPLNFPDTFWQERYGTGPDPTFILPWRLDPEKGFNLGSAGEAKREQTRDIRFVPDDPEPGETVTVAARVHNYSLLPSPAVEVRFYLGDPDAGGTRIFPDAAGPLFTEVIEPRASDVISFEWTLPMDVNVPSARVYAVVDPDDAIPNEIHEDNNRAWNALAIPTPEPSSGAAVAASLAVLLWRTRRRSH